MVLKSSLEFITERFHSEQTRAKIYRILKNQYDIDFRNARNHDS